MHIATADLYNLHTLSPEDFTFENWEVKPEPMKFEFECTWEYFAMIDRYLPIIDDREVPYQMGKSGKRFKIICEEIMEE